MSALEQQAIAFKKRFASQPLLGSARAPASNGTPNVVKRGIGLLAANLMTSVTSCSKHHCSWKSFNESVALCCRAPKGMGYM
jgi:hypothetical protein